MDARTRDLDVPGGEQSGRDRDQAVRRGGLLDRVAAATRSEQRRDGYRQHVFGLRLGEGDADRGLIKTAARVIAAERDRDRDRRRRTARAATRACRPASAAVTGAV